MARYAIPVLLITAAFFAAAAVVHGQKKTFDIEQVRNNFKTASAEYVEIVGDEIAGLESEKRPGAYWLVRVRPKKTGHYAVKYVYKYDDTFYGDGENTINIGVDPGKCDRRSEAESGISRFCLGDTVILPVRAGNRYNYSFSVKYTEEAAPKIDRVPLRDYGAAVLEQQASGGPVKNPLESNLKFLGIRSETMLHRNSGSTVTYFATFQAVAAGRFNIALSTESEKGTSPAAPTVPGEGTAVLILEPGTPVTCLAPHEDTINYADEKKFSSHSGGNFPTNLLVLQPGEVFSLPFSTITTRDNFVKKTDKLQAAPWPVIRKAPFVIDRKWGYNQFIADYFPLTIL
jgi:hypothetical protein